MRTINPLSGQFNGLKIPEVPADQTPAAAQPVPLQNTPASAPQPASSAVNQPHDPHVIPESIPALPPIIAHAEPAASPATPPTPESAIQTNATPSMPAGTVSAVGSQTVQMPPVVRSTTIVKPTSIAAAQPIDSPLTPPSAPKAPATPGLDHPANLSAKPLQPRQPMAVQPQTADHMPAAAVTQTPNPARQPEATTAPTPPQSQDATAQSNISSKTTESPPNQSKLATKETTPAPKATPKSDPNLNKPLVQSYAMDHNDTLMRSSNPFAATLSGIELLIKRNGLVSIGYVTVFVVAYALFGGGLYALGKFGTVAFISNNTAVLQIIGAGILLIFLYLHSFIVCVASEAGQSLTLRQVFYLARQKLFKLLVLQIITILATGIGLVLGIIPGVIILGRLMLAPFMVFESDHPSIMTALKRSNKLTKGRTFEMSGLVLVQIIMLSTGLLGLASMAAGPAARYQQLRLRLQDKAAITKVHYLNYVMSVLLCFAFLGAFIVGGLQIYNDNQRVCYSTVVYTSGRPAPSSVCVKRHVCQKEIICKATLD